MTVIHLGVIGAGWFAAGLVWWWVLARIGLRFEARGQKAIPGATRVSFTIEGRTAALERERALRRSKKAVLN